MFFALVTFVAIVCRFVADFYQWTPTMEPTLRLVSSSIRMLIFATLCVRVIMKRDKSLTYVLGSLLSGIPD